MRFIEGLKSKLGIGGNVESGPSPEPKYSTKNLFDGHAMGARASSKRIPDLMATRRGVMIDQRDLVDLDGHTLRRDSKDHPGHFVFVEDNGMELLKNQLFSGIDRRPDGGYYLYYYGATGDPGGHDSPRELRILEVDENLNPVNGSERGGTIEQSVQEIVETGESLESLAAKSRVADAKKLEDVRQELNKTDQTGL